MIRMQKICGLVERFYRFGIKIAIKYLIDLGKLLYKLNMRIETKNKILNK